MRIGALDERLGVRVVSRRELVYTEPARTNDDRPPHVRAASGLALVGGVLHVLQDDAAYIARVDGDRIDTIALPAVGGARRFEAARGNRLDKPDLEACVVIDGELIALGSGSLAVREQIYRVRGGTVAALDAAIVYVAVRAALGSIVNLEGAACVGGELWLFHRGNTGAAEDRGPAIARMDLDAFRAWRDHRRPPAPQLQGRYDLGDVGGVRFGFTDADARDEHVVFVAAAEASRDAIADGAVGGCRIGVIAAGAVRMIDLRFDGVGKVEGIALDPREPSRAWLVTDPDDPRTPAVLYQVELTGPWWS